jgi:hypothetical protein
MLHGSINHVSITVSDLRGAMEFFGPVLRFLVARITILR